MKNQKSCIRLDFQSVLRLQALLHKPMSEWSRRLTDMTLSFTSLIPNPCVNRLSLTLNIHVSLLTCANMSTGFPAYLEVPKQLECVMKWFYNV